MNRRAYRISAGLLIGCALASIAVIAIHHLPPRHDNPQAASMPAGARFVALDGSEVYHTLDCGFTARAAPERKKFYPTTQAAEAAGFRPCRKCRP